MKVIPLEDRVLIKTAELEEKTKSGLFIPQTAQEKTQVGVVTAVGSDKEEIKVKVGQKIMYDKYAGTSIKVDGAEYLIIKSKDILAIIED
jgi:chaperonin GroES